MDCKILEQRRPENAEPFDFLHQRASNREAAAALRLPAERLGPHSTYPPHGNPILIAIHTRLTLSTQHRQYTAQLLSGCSLPLQAQHTLTTQTQQQNGAHLPPFAPAAPAAVRSPGQQNDQEYPIIIGKQHAHAALIGPQSSSPRCCKPAPGRVEPQALACRPRFPVWVCL